MIRSYFRSVVCIATGACVLLSVASTFGQTGSQGSQQTELRNLFDQFQALTSIEFRASVELTVGQPLADRAETIAPQQGTQGTYRYSAAGDRYKIESFVNPNKYPGLNTQVAFDGGTFYLSLEPGKLLSYGSQDHATLLPTLPNPLLQLVQFAYPETDDNSDLELHLKDVQNNAPPAAFWNVQWVAIVENGIDLEYAEFPGGSYEGQDYVHRVYAVPGARNKPFRIDRVTADGRKLTSCEFGNYFDVPAGSGETFWPRTVQMTAFDQTGTEAGHISFVLTDLSVNQAMPANSFAISTAVVAQVWNDDLQSFER